MSIGVDRVIEHCDTTSTAELKVSLQYIKIELILIFEVATIYFVDGLWRTLEVSGWGLVS